jgi:hypothetical protein
MTDGTGPGGRTAASATLVVAAALLVAAASLMYWTLQLPFTAGRPFSEVLVPVGALAVAVAGGMVAARGRRKTDASRMIRGWAHLVGTLSWLAAAMSTAILFLIFAMCGLFWTRTTC